MSNFLLKIKLAFQRFMQGRHGVDQLSVALVWGGLIAWLIGSIFSSVQVWAFAIIGFIITLAGFACYVYSMFRIFSRNNEKRMEENRRYLSVSQKKKTEMRQAQNRLKNRKQYKYFKCPGCKAWLKLPRGSGVVTLTCRRCHTNFTQKS